MTDRLGGTVPVEIGGGLRTMAEIVAYLDGGGQGRARVRGGQ